MDTEKHDVGYMWYDADPKTSLETKILNASRYYQQKYGKLITTCYVHRSFLPEGQTTCMGIKVFGMKTILPHHFWMLA